MDQSFNELRAVLSERITYRYDLFISYSSGQNKDALALYEELSKSMTVFYAPITLQTLEHQPGQYVEVLTGALMQSCQVLVLLSESYLESSWCQLELYGYFNLYLEELKRRIWVVALEQDIEKEIVGQFVPLIFNREEALENLINRFQEKEISLGDKFAEYDPPKLFTDLPLYERYEPPTSGNRPPWGKNSRSPHGVPGAPPFEVYQQLVRECMVQLKRQGDNPFEQKEIELSIPMIGIDERYDYMKKAAREDAQYMNSMGLSPYAGTAKLNIRDLFAKMMQAHFHKQEITHEMDCHEAFARICMGDLDEGIDKMEKAIEQDPDSPHLKLYIIELARAKYSAKDFKGALSILETMDIKFEAEKLIQAAALARLGELSDAEKERNRKSDVSVNRIRMLSLMEDREQLDYWAEGLELAGYAK